MNGQLIRAAWHLLAAGHKTPSRRLIQQTLRMVHGTAPRTDEVHAWLHAYQRRREDGSLFLLPYAGPVEVQSGSTQDNLSAEQSRMDTGITALHSVERVQSGSLRADQQGKVQADTTSPPFVSLTPETIVPTPQAEPAAIDVAATKVKTKRDRKPKADQEIEFTYTADTSVLDELPDAHDERQPRWVRDMRMLWVPKVVDRPISGLNADHRFALARYHAWRWANCRVDEARNRSAAMRIAAGVANLAADKRYGTLTVKNYIDLGDEAWCAGGRRPMHSVWPLVGRIPVAA